MRPPILFPLFAEARSLAGVGGKVEKLLAKAVDRPPEAPEVRVLDLVFHLPIGLVDRSYRPTLAEAEPGRLATVAVNVLDHRAAPRGTRLPYRVTCTDDGAAIEIVFFAAHEDRIRKALPPGTRRAVSGRIDLYQGRMQMAHPDTIAPNLADIPLTEPVYRTTGTLAPRSVAKAVRGALERLPDLEEWQDQAFLGKQGWPGFSQALRMAHDPSGDGDLLPVASARRRLAYDELLANQLVLALIRARNRTLAGRTLHGDGRLRKIAARNLPFLLTEAQRAALDEILGSMAEPSRMVRLLQGDVGSGKTVVAAMALLQAVEAGTQGALMAPTEILARQHMASLEAILRGTGVRLALLTGKGPRGARDATVARLERGEIDILVGTHALFSDDVVFRDLGLAVVDEQHRFGVHQRMRLQRKGGAAADVLVMTATPIPRTLQLTHFGDMEVSRLTGKPPGRQPVQTRAVPSGRMTEIVEAVRRATIKGGRVYWICPLVEESEKSDLAAAEERRAYLTRALGPNVGLVHGRMNGRERDAEMARFRAGDTHVLVATTVIEVGVDVPEANVIVIEHAERFGLAQLHQLRGRVGRGAGRAACLLLYQPPLGPAAKERIATLRATEDGFVIAEEDLRLRGAGEALGVRQSGVPAFIFADPSVHADLLAAAHDDAKLAILRDPDLTSPRGQALRTLLYLFERDHALAYLRAG